MAGSSGWITAAAAAAILFVAWLLAVPTHFTIGSIWGADFGPRQRTVQMLFASDSTNYTVLALGEEPVLVRNSTSTRWRAMAEVRRDLQKFRLPLAFCCRSPAELPLIWGFALTLAGPRVPGKCISFIDCFCLPLPVPWLAASALR